MGLEEEILDSLEKYMSTDVYYEEGRVLSSTCTNPHPFALRVFRRFQLANLGDPGLFPGAKLLEKQALRIIGELFHHPHLEQDHQIGHFVTGGTEANLTALWTARNRWLAASKTRDRSKATIVAAESAHLSIEKTANMLNVSLLKVPVTEDHVFDVDWMMEHVDPRNVVAIVATAGTTLLGAIDPIRELSEYSADNDVWLHVDAAIGGFILPFYPLLGRGEVLFDFQLEGVRSITADVHKMGMCPVPGGTVVFRDPEDLKHITFYLPYLLPEARVQSTMTGTRTAGAAIAFHALYQLLGREGFASTVKECLENTNVLKEQMIQKGLNPVIEPPMNILGFQPVTENTKRILKRLHDRRWRISEVKGILRFVLMPHVKRHHLISFLVDWDECSD